MFDQANSGGNGTTTTTMRERVRSLQLPRTTQAQRGSSSWLAWTLCLVFAGTSGYLYVNGPPGSPESRSDDSKSVAATTTSSSESSDSRPAEPRPAGRVALTAGGYIIPVHRVQVSPKVGGEVTDLYIEEGQYIKKGQLLARLEKSRYEFAYRQMAAMADQALARWEKLKTGSRLEEKEQAHAALHEAEEQRTQLRDEVDRLRRARGAASAEELVKAQARLSMAEFKVQQLSQAYKMTMEGPRKEEIAEAYQSYLHACAQRDEKKYDLDNTDVIAPVSGIILIKRAEVGNTVRPEAFSNGLSASLCEMADLKELEVDVDISERDLTSVFVGQECEIRTEAFPDKVYKGKLARLMPEANRSKASVSARVRIDVPEDESMLRPEMRGRVTFLSKDADKKNKK